MSLQGRRLSSKELDSILLGMLRSPARSGVDILCEADEHTVLALFKRARAHKALVLLARVFHEFHESLGQVGKVLADIYQKSLTNDRTLVKGMLELIAKFEQAGIQVMGYKGPVIWRALQLASPSKISGDIDLVIRPTDREKAHALLDSLDYRCSTISTPAANYESPENLCMDLHWSILQWNDQSSEFEEQLWSNPLSVGIEGHYVQTLSPTMTTLALLFHASIHHACRNWAALSDISRCTVVWRDKIDWAHLLDMADCVNLRYSLHAPLWFVREHFDAIVPEEVMEAVALRSYHRPLQTIAYMGFHARVPKGIACRMTSVLYNLLSQSTFHGAMSFISNISKRLVSCWIGKASRLIPRHG